ncbi:MAG: nitrilase family protein, partial [Duncaniella sp.]|nr:nitrilase family protein [Duncaniella sp.]
VYTAGRELSPRIRYRGWEFRLALCFDIRFPVWTRNRPDNMYDVLLVPANWPHSRAAQFKILLAARAIENQIYVVASNRSGSDKFGDYHLSDSGIFDNLGAPIQETRRNGYLYALLERKELEEGRKKFPAYVATDNWSIEL